jgi:hypothetical protein
MTGDVPVRTGARRSFSKYPKGPFYSTTHYLIRICDNLVGGRAIETVAATITIRRINEV